MLKYHAIGLGLIVGTFVLSLEGYHLVAAMALYCAYMHAQANP